MIRKKQEKNASKIKHTRKTQGMIPAPMGKPKPKAQGEVPEKGKGKGKGKGAGKGTKALEKRKGKGTFLSKKDADYEHAGVGFAIHQKWLKHPEEVKEVNGRIIVLRFTGAGGSIAFISIRKNIQTHSTTH